MGFGVSNNVRSRVVRTCTPALFWETVRLPIVARTCAEIEDAWERWKRGEIHAEEFEQIKAYLKKKLPIFTFHATFKNGRRLNADALPSGLSMYDIDHIADPRGYWEKKREELKMKDMLRFVALVHVTPSGEGLRLVFVMPRGMDLPSAQKWMSGQLGDANYDPSVKDLARSSFVVPEDYILYVNEEKLFSMDNGRAGNGNNPSPLRGAPLRQGSCPDTQGVLSQREPSAISEKLPCFRGAGSQSETEGFETGLEDSPKKELCASASLCSNGNSSLSFKGIPYAEIIQRWFQLTGGEPVEGERNDKLHRLASHLRYITDNDEEKLLQIMPRYGLPEEEMRGLIHSACSAKWYAMPRVLKQAIENKNLKTGNGEMPPMPKKLPALIRLLISRTPELYKPAVAHAVFPPLATHLHRVRFRYIDNVEHEATLMNVLMAGTGAGKDCISEPINRIMADIRLRDAENLMREREWKNEINSKGSNKDKRKRPEGLVIQEIDADMTNPAFVLRTAEAEGHFLYTKLNEIDQFDALRGAGRGGQQFQIMCLAFDPGNRYGQTRVGTQSITEKVTIRFNWNAATTLLKGKRYFAKVLTDGPISRINFCTIPEREIGAEMPIYGTYDASFDEELRPYIENLNRATGLVDCPEAYRLAEQMRDEHAEEARLSQNRVYENLSFRANVIAYLKACVLYVANGGKWDKPMEEFVRWSFEYDMWCKMEFFGDAIARAMSEDTSETRKHPGRKNLLTLLPDEFTLQEAVRVRQAQGLDAEGTRNMLSQWAHRNYITILTNDNYRKLKYRHDGNDIDPKNKA